MTETITPTTPYLLDPAFLNLEGINRMERAKLILKQHRSVQKKNPEHLFRQIPIGYQHLYRNEN